MVILVALTGNIACGKSTISRHWQRKGCDVIDTDKLAADALAIDSPGYRQVLQVFGEHRTELVQEDGSLDRKRLGQIVFSNRSKKRKLERIVWPQVYKKLAIDVVKLIFKGLWRSDTIVVVEIPQLFESGSFVRKVLDSVVVVGCLSQDKQMSRLLLRNPDMSEEDARDRLKSQMPIEEKCRLADHFIDNTGDISDGLNQADEVLYQIKTDYISSRNRKLLLMLTSIGFVSVLLFLTTASY